jgi:hypothetical protein
MISINSPIACNGLPMQAMGCFLIALKKITSSTLLLAILLPLSTPAQPYLRLQARGAAWMMEQWS